MSTRHCSSPGATFTAFRLTAFVLTASLLTATLCRADPADDYRHGVDAFKQGEYQEALVFFTRAYDAGERDPPLFFNLGSVQFKLGNFAAAHDEFEHIADDPTWGPLAQYNLGLIETRRGDQVKAQQHYRVAYATAQSDKLRQLAASKLAVPASQAQVTDKWFGIASLGAGYDDNVVLLNDQSLTQVTDKHDYFADALASASGFIQGSVDRGWRADVSGYYRAYRDLTDYDYGNAAVGLAYNRIAHGAQWQLGGRAEEQFVGGDAYTTTGSIRAQLLHPIGLFNLRVRNDVSYIHGASNYDYLTGWLDRLAMQISRSFDKTRLRLGYELELNDRRDYSTATEFFSYSPVSNRFYTEATQFISEIFDAQLSVAYQASRYADKNVQTNPDNTVTIGKRNDDRIVASMRLIYHLTKEWNVYGEYAFANNSSKFSEYEYSDNQVMLGIERPF